MSGDIDITNIQDTTPSAAPVVEPDPLTGKEKAGVWLTWGIIGLVVLFLLVILGIFFWGEYKFDAAFTKVSELKPSDTTGLTVEGIKGLADELSKSLESFRAFWFDTLQLILLNVLFPTLTALLGYVFGTSKSNGSQ